MKRNNRISVFFIGQDRVGKTSLKKRILGETFDSQEPSTVGIEVDIVEVDEKDKAKPWQRTRDQQRMASQEQVNGAIGEYAAKRLKDSEKSDLTEVKQQHKPKPRHRTADHQRMAPGENVNNIMAEDSSQTMKHSERFGTTEVKQQGKVKHHKNDKGNKKSHVILTPELKKIIKENMVKVDKYEDDMTKVRLLLQDVAGQSPLYDIHSILLRLQSLFVLVVGLDKDLADEAKPLFVDERKNIKIEIENYLLETNLDYANRWMSALHHISLDRELTEETNFVPPATILVLTKPDMVTGTLEQIQQKIQKATDTLLDSFTDYKCRPHIVGTFVIDNTKSEHSELQNLREKIFETSQEILKAQDKFPINWLRLERGLVTVMESERYITWQDVEELGRESGVNENLAAAVESLHQQNVVVHFRDDEKARNLVVLDPQWLVKLFTSIITIPPTHKQSPKRAELWKCLTDRGELLSDFLDIVLVDHTKHLQALTRMMERVSLICRWNEKSWLVPSMAKSKKARRDVQELLKACSLPPLYVVVQGGYLPLGLFTRLQVYFIRLYKILCREMPCLSCYFSRLPLKEGNLKYSVILVQHLSRIQVAIMCDDQPTSQHKLPEISSKVKSDLSTALKEIERSNPIYAGAKYHFAVKCDCDCYRVNPVKCPRHQRNGCDSEDCVHLFSLEELQNGENFCDRNDDLFNVEKVRPWMNRKGNNCVGIIG